MWRRWGTPRNFCLIYIHELEKQLFIKKTVKWSNEKCKNFNIYNAVNVLKNKEKHLEILFYTCVPNILMIWSTVLEIYIQCWQQAQKTEIFLPFWDIFCPLTLLTTRKIKLLENWKKMPGDIILHLSATNDDHMYGSWAQHTIFCNFGAIFCNQNSTSKIKILKK